MLLHAAIVAAALIPSHHAPWHPAECDLHPELSQCHNVGITVGIEDHTTFFNGGFTIDSAVKPAVPIHTRKIRNPHHH